MMSLPKTVQKSHKTKEEVPLASKFVTYVVYQFTSLYNTLFLLINGLIIREIFG